MEGIDYYGYVVYKDGSIRGKRGDMLKTRLNPNGYETVDLYIDHKTKTVPVHIIIASCYHYKPYNATCVHHKNSVKTDNRACNLQWVTASQNNRFHAIDSKNGHRVCCDDGCFKIEYTSIGDASCCEEVSESHIRYWLNKGRRDKQGRLWFDSDETKLYLRQR